MSEATKSQLALPMNRRQRTRRIIIMVSFLLFPVTLNYFSPYIIINGAAQGIIAGSFITFVLLFIFSLGFGRAWCGWACPAAGIQEWCFSMNNKAAPGGKFNWIKYFIWVPWLSAIIAVAVLAGGLSRVNPLHLTESGISVSEAHNLIDYFTVVFLFVILSLAVGRRAFCHYSCWMSPFMIIGTRIKSWLRLPSLQLGVTGKECQQCATCDKNCPMSLPVHTMVQRGSMGNTECILCGTCVDNCPNRVIRFSWGFSNKARTTHPS